MGANLVYFVLPTILMILGFPIYLVLILTSLAAIVFVADVPLVAVPTYMFGSLDNFPLLAVPYFVLAGEIMSQGSIARRVVAWVVSIIGGIRGSLAVTTVASSELFGAMAHTSVGTVVAVGRLDLSVAPGEWLQSVILHWSDHLVGRGRRDHSAVDRHDPLFNDGTGISAGLVHRRRPAEHSDWHHRRRLCVCLFARQSRAAARSRALGQYLGHHQGCRLGDRHGGGDLRRHLQRHLYADRGGRRRRDLLAVRHHRRLSRAWPRRSLARAGELGVLDFADPDDRRRRWALLLAA